MDQLQQNVFYLDPQLNKNHSEKTYNFYEIVKKLFADELKSIHMVRGLGNRATKHCKKWPQIEVELDIVVALHNHKHTIFW